MNNFLKPFLLVLNIAFFVFVMVFMVFGVIEQLLGPAKAMKLLERLKIPWSYNRVLLVGFICLAITIVLFIVRKKLFGE